MAVVEIKLNPTRSDLKWFGLMMLVFFGILGTVFYFKVKTLNTAYTLWSLGVVVAFVYYLAPRLRHPMYVGWMRAVFPLGWLISHVVLSIVYYVVVTPIGLIMRLFRYDPMKRHFEPDSPSYWVEHKTGVDPARYFRQF